MSADLPAGRRRTYVFPGRQKRLSIRVTDGEDAEINAAANRLGLTPTGFCAHATLDAARNLPTGTTERMEHEALGNLQAELFQARTTLNQLRAELNRVPAVHDQATADLGQAFAAASASLVGIDEVISRIHRLLNKRHRREGHT